MFTHVYFGLIILHTTVYDGVYCKVPFDVGAGENQKIVTIRRNSSNLISIHNISSSVSVLLFGIHAHSENVTLSETAGPCLHCSVTGRNIGMVYRLSAWETQAQMWLLNRNQKMFSVLVTVTPLLPDEPIPGACNIEFPTDIAPYLRLRIDSGRIFIEYQHANIGLYREEPAPSCSPSLPYLTYDIYVSYLKENDFGEEEYFDKISSMSNQSLIKQVSTKVLSYSLHPDTRFSFLNYPNIGVVYNIIAKYTVNGVTRETLYIPVASYGCSKVEVTEHGCNYSYIFEEKMLLFFLSMYGFITAFFGHLFYRSTIFFFGFLSAFFVTLILYGRYLDLSKAKILSLSVFCGILSGGAWFLLHQYLHSSVLSLLLVGLVLGFLLTATILYSPVGNFEINLNTKNYWLLLTTGSLLVTIIFIAFPTGLFILGSSVVGTYIMLLFYDDFIGTRLAYIILNIIKRAVSEKVDFAVNHLPFQIKDAIIYAAWILLSIFAIIVQARRLKSSNSINNWSIKLCCCKSFKSNYDHQSAAHEPLCNNHSVSYNTFSY